LYLASWLRGQGAAPIHNLMEDAATAEISRAQLWQWRVHGAKMDDGRAVDAVMLEQQFTEILGQMRAASDAAQWKVSRNEEAAGVMRALVFDDDFAEFLTLPAYELIK
jgi:malate synthase